MKLQQLRYLAAIVEADFNISAAANKLHLSQPGVSRQLKLLEDELGFELFVRDGRALEKPPQAHTDVELPARHRARQQATPTERDDHDPERQPAVERSAPGERHDAMADERGEQHDEIGRAHV